MRSCAWNCDTFEKKLSSRERNFQGRVLHFQLIKTPSFSSVSSIYSIIAAVGIFSLKTSLKNSWWNWTSAKLFLFFYKLELQKTRTKTMYQTSLVHDSYSSSFSFSDLKLSTERNNECRVTSTFDFAQPSKAFWQFSKMLTPATLSILFWSR